MNNTIHIATSIYYNETGKMLTRYAQGKDSTKKNTSYMQKNIKRPILR